MTIPTLKAHNARLEALLLKVQALKKPPNGWPALPKVPRQA